MTEGKREFVASLWRFRYRLVLVKFVEVLPPLAAVASVIVVAVARLFHLALWAFIPTLLGGLAAASAIAAFVAGRRVGPLSQTASLLDVRFGLANRLATAVQFSDVDDAVSRLIVRDASAALARRRPNDLPFEAPRHAGLIAGGFAVVMIALVLVGRPSVRDDDHPASQGVLGGLASATAESAARTAGAASAQASSDAQQSRVVAVSDDRREHSPLSASTTGSTETQEARLQREDAARRIESSSDAAETGRGASPPDIRAASRGAAGNNAAPGRAPSSASSGVGTAKNSVADARGAVGGGAGIAESRATTMRAGGVRGAAPLEVGQSSSGERSQTAASESPASAWDRAEAALAREHLPLDRRVYVRDYLIAIRPGRQR